jgi:hypothetical protein
VKFITTDFPCGVRQLYLYLGPPNPNQRLSGYRAILSNYSSGCKRYEKYEKSKNRFRSNGAKESRWLLLFLHVTTRQTTKRVKAPSSLNCLFGTSQYRLSTWAIETSAGSSFYTAVLEHLKESVCHGIHHVDYLLPSQSSRKPMRRKSQSVRVYAYR